LVGEIWFAGHSLAATDITIETVIADYLFCLGTWGTP